MTGKRLYYQVLSWDYVDYSPSCWRNTQNNTTKRWSKKVRRFLKEELELELLEYNSSTSPQHLTTVRRGENVC